MKAFLLAVGLGLHSALAAAFNYAIVQDACIGGIQPVPSFPIAPIPVGCELVDCCPGCPGTGPIEWRIKFESKLATSAELRFDGLSREQIDKLDVRGTAKRDGERIVLRPGSTRIGGIPQDGGAPVAVGMLQALASEQAATRLPKLPRGQRERILVEQFMGPFLVNRFSWTWVPLPCIKPPKPPVTEDVLKIEGIAAGEDVKVMLDARSTTDGCMDGGSTPERTFSSTGYTWLDNMRSPDASCRSEVAVFSQKYRMYWQSLAWTNSLGDVRTVTPEPLIDAALNVWITDEAYRADAEDAAQKAHDLFLENRVGVNLVWNVQNVTAVPNAPTNAVQIVSAGVSDDLFADCLDLASIRAQPFYIANTLNVYYVNKPWTGRNCAIKKVPGLCITSPSAPDFVKADANITFIGLDANPTTLAHELGHAYGIRPAVCAGAHVAPPDFTAENIMFPSGSTSTTPRSTLTLGQVFRMNTHSDGWGGSMMLQNNATGRMPQPCFPHLFSAACPRSKLPWPP